METTRRIPSSERITDPWSEFEASLRHLREKTQVPRLRATLQGGPFEWVGTLSPKCFGDVFGLSVATFVMSQLLGLDVHRARETEYDLVVAGRRCELKTSAEIDNRGSRHFMFSQVRRFHRWDLLALLGIKNRSLWLALLERDVVNRWMAEWDEAWRTFLLEIRDQPMAEAKSAWIFWRLQHRPFLCVEAQSDGKSIGNLSDCEPEMFRVSTRLAHVKEALVPYSVVFSPDGLTIPPLVQELLSDFQIVQQDALKTGRSRMGGIAR